MNDFTDWAKVFGEGSAPPADDPITGEGGCTCKCWQEPFIKDAVVCTTNPRCPVHGWKKEANNV